MEPAYQTAGFLFALKRTREYGIVKMKETKVECGYVAEKEAGTEGAQGARYSPLQEK